MHLPSPLICGPFNLAAEPLGVQTPAGLRWRGLMRMDGSRLGEARCRAKDQRKDQIPAKGFSSLILCARQGAHARCVYRPAPEPGGGVNVDPLGEVFIKLFPEGFRLLFAPAAALPAPLLRPPLAPFVEVPVVPLFVDPVVVPLAAGAPAAELPLAEPLPLCASANVPESTNAAATPIPINLMVSFLSVIRRASCCAEICSALKHQLCIVDR